MTKQEFAIKLLFWLMPWPLSKALPKLLTRILYGPAGQTPLQWAQATYDALTQYFSDVTPYAQNLLELISDITPTEQLSASAAILQTTIEIASSSFATLTEIVATIDDYAVDQIWHAFLDAMNAMHDLTAATDALLDAIQDLPAADRPDIPLPPPPPDIPPFPPIYPGEPAPGLPAPIYPPGNIGPKGRWVAHFDDTNWEWDDTYPTYTAWDDIDLLWYPIDSICQMLSIGTWPTDYRPTKMRITFTGTIDPCHLRLSGNGGDIEIASDLSYYSGQQITLDFTEDVDIGMLNMTAIVTITNIEFFEA